MTSRGSSRGGRSKAGASVTVAAILAIASVVPAGCGGLKLADELHVNPYYLPAVERLQYADPMSSDSVTPPLSFAWEQDVSAGVGGEAPARVDSVIIVGNLRGELVALHLRDGRRIGSVSLGNSIHASPTLNGATAYVPISGSPESLIAFDLLNGRVLWKQLYGDLQASPLLLNRRLYVGNTSGTFFCVDDSAGDVVWKYDLPDNTKLKGIRSTAAGDSMGVIFGAEDAAVYALDLHKGTPTWRCAVDGPVQAPVVLSEGLVFAATTRGMVYAIDRGTGTVRWSARADSPIYARATPARGAVIIGSTSGAVNAYAVADGRLLWKYTAAGPINAGGVLSASYLYLGTLKKEIFALDIQTGTVVWRTSVAGRVKTPPLVAGGTVIFATDEPSIVAFQEIHR
jgi:outer membrane protein assembly factor BamB